MNLYYRAHFVKQAPIGVLAAKTVLHSMNAHGLTHGKPPSLAHPAHK
jgi:hypothetical protein